MGDKRIPVSLKFDDETDFYTDFITDLKERKELSDFIVDLLRAYYEKEEIRDIVDNFRNIVSPFSDIMKQIERINVEHDKTIQTAAILKNIIKNKHDQYSGDLARAMSENSIKSPMEEFNNGASVNVMSEILQVMNTVKEEKEKPPVMPVVDDTLLKRLEAMEQVLPAIDKKLDLLMSRVETNVMSVQTPKSESIRYAVIVDEQPVNKVEESVKMVTRVNEGNTVQMVTRGSENSAVAIQSQNIGNENVKNIAPIIEQQIISSTKEPNIKDSLVGIEQINSFASDYNNNNNVTSINSHVNNANSDSSEVAEKEEKPASFNKMFNSLNKRQASV